MAGMSTGGAGPQAEPNVVPMIDIMLVLLIIFMIAQPLARMAIDVQVPPLDTPEAAPDQPPTQIVLELTPTGGYVINGTPYTREQLPNALESIYYQRPHKLLFIKAAPNRIYQEVIDAMDVARGAGVQGIGFTPKEVN